MTFQYDHTYWLFATPEGLTWGEWVDDVGHEQIHVRFTDQGPLVLKARRDAIQQWTPQRPAPTVGTIRDAEGQTPRVLREAALEAPAPPWWRN